MYIYFTFIIIVILVSIILIISNDLSIRLASIIYGYDYKELKSNIKIEKRNYKKNHKISKKK